MEISIKWNICRICLREDDKDKINQMKPIFGSSDIAKNIFDFSGVVVRYLLEFLIPILSIYDNDLRFGI